MTKEVVIFPKIVPSTRHHYAYIKSEDIDALKDKNRVPIAVRIFGASIDGTMTFIKPSKSNPQLGFRRLKFFWKPGAASSFPCKSDSDSVSAEK